MKIYKIKVNGKAYEVEVEAVDEVNGHVEASAPAKTNAATGAGNEVKAPMAGTINDVKVKVGQNVNVGDTLVILEAMKLENEVKSQFAGTIKEINVSKGSSVKNGDVIIIIA